MQSTGDNALCVSFDGVPSSPFSSLVMLKQMGSGYTTSVLRGLGQVAWHPWASNTYLENEREFKYY